MKTSGTSHQSSSGYLHIVSRYLRGVSVLDYDEERSIRLHSQHYNQYGDQKYQQTTHFTYLPDDTLAIIFKYLPPKDVISCELVCRQFRDIIIHYNIYKSMLDSICRRKRINNYMVLSDKARQGKTSQERSAYYKTRLYHYTNKFRLRLDVKEDAYIETYKVGRRKQELDRLVERSMKRFSLSGV